MSDDQRRSGTPVHGVRISVLNSFELRRDDDIVVLPHDARRVIAYLALNRRPQPRTSVASVLWPQLGDQQAAATLHATLTQLRTAAPGVIEEAADELAIAPAVDSDLESALATVRLLEDVSQYRRELIDPLCKDVLPDWSDAWVPVERERYRQIRLHAMESLCRRLTAAGLHSAAIEVGHVLVDVEPWRESARRALIEAHLAEGNISEAVRQYDSFVELLRSGGGFARPSELMGLFTPSPAWPVLRVRRPILPTVPTLPGVRNETTARRRMVARSGSSAGPTRG